MFLRKSVYGAAIAALIATPMSVGFTTSGWAQVGNIVVTTRKREENLQDIPLSVTAIGSIQIQQRGINSVGDAIKFTPGTAFDVGYGGQDTRIVIRGLSPTRGRPNAAFLVDGIDFTGEAVSTAGGGFAVNQRLVDIERIEVVKGPQSALYGRSAFAGAVQYITKSPNMDEFEFEGGFDVSAKRQYEVTASAGGPVTDILGLRINGIWYDEDGFYVNTISEDGERIGGAKGWGLAGTALFEPTDALSFKARVAYSEDDYEVGAQARVPSNTVGTLPPSLVRSTFLGFGPDCTTAGKTSSARDQALTSCANLPRPFFTGEVPDGDTLTIANAVDPRTNNDYPGTELETLNVTLVSEWDVNFGTITSYTGYANSESTQLFEGNFDAQPPGTYVSIDGVARVYTLPDCGLKNCSPAHQEVDFINETTLWSQELRFASDFDGPFNFTVGGLYWNEDVDQNEGGITISPAILGRGQLGGPFASMVETFPVGGPLILGVSRPNRSVNSRDVEHWSAYAIAEWEFTDQLKATFEGRYVDEKLTRLGPQCDVPATEALTGLLGVDIGTDLNGDGEITGSETITMDGIRDVCHANFRGPSSTTASVAGGSLPVGTLTAALTKDLVAESSESFFAPKLTLEWTPMEDQLWYFSVAQGVKPGGISTILAGNFFAPSTKTFDKEKLRVYEIGGKTTWLDGTLQINGAGYYQKYTDKQTGVTQFNPVTNVDVSGIDNAGAARIWGLEFDAIWQPDEHWTVTAGYSWIDAEYTEFRTVTGSRTEVIESILYGNGGCLEIIDNEPGLDPDGLGPTLGPGATDQDNTTDLCLIDNSGNAIEDIAKHSFVGSIQYTRQLASTDIDWFIQANAIYSSKRFAEPNNLEILPSYWTADLRAGLTSEIWDLIVYVDNVFDDDTVKSVLAVGSQIETVRQSLFPPGPSGNMIAILPDPRVVGVRGQVRF